MLKTIKKMKRGKAAGKRKKLTNSLKNRKNRDKIVEEIIQLTSEKKESS